MSAPETSKVSEARLSLALSAVVNSLPKCSCSAGAGCEVADARREALAALAAQNDQGWLKGLAHRIARAVDNGVSLAAARGQVLTTLEVEAIADGVVKGATP